MLATNSSPLLSSAKWSEIERLVIDPHTDNKKYVAVKV